jgi:hypothetical protein
MEKQQQAQSNVQFQANMASSVGGPMAQNQAQRPQGLAQNPGPGNPGQIRPQGTMNMTGFERLMPPEVKAMTPEQKMNWIKNLMAKQKVRDLGQAKETSFIIHLM